MLPIPGFVTHLTLDPQDIEFSSEFKYRLAQEDQDNTFYVVVVKSPVGFLILDEKHDPNLTGGPTVWLVAVRPDAQLAVKFATQYLEDRRAQFCD